MKVDNTYPWEIMTDKQKGLICVVQQVYSEFEHKLCVRHLYSNFKEKFKGPNLKEQLCACARSTSLEQFQRNLDIMNAPNIKVYGWLEQMAPNTWVRAYLSEFPSVAFC